MLSVVIQSIDQHQRYQLCQSLMNRRSLFLFLVINACLWHSSVAVRIPVDYFVTSSNLYQSFQSVTLDSVERRTNEKKLIVKLEVRLGLNKSNTNFNKGFPKPIVPVETTWKSGFVGGFALKIYLMNKFYVQQEYLYSQMGGRVNTIFINYKLTYISLPILFNYKVNNYFVTKAGPQFDLLVRAEENDDTNFTNIIHETESRNIGLVLGVEFLFSKNISIEARYMQGINHISIKQRTVTKEFKYEAAQLTINYIF